MSSGAIAMPFVGLRPFESHESLLFFGRLEQTMALMTKLHETRFLAVVGSSGSGKSSLIRAGLIPKLKAGFLVEERDHWHIAMMKPGDQPLENLAAAMLDSLGQTADVPAVEALVEQYRSDGVRGVEALLRPYLEKGDANFLLLVDQFEEIFRFILTHQDTRRRYDAHEFVALMIDLVEQSSLPIYVVMTMRSDFIGDCDAFHGLPEALNRSQYLVPRLTRKQRRDVIEGPIRLFGGQIHTSLVNRLLNDLGETDDQLPILQHALMRTWNYYQRDPGGTIDTEHYLAAGTLANALSKHANEALQSLDDDGQNLARILFRTLTDTDASNRRIRRPAHMSEIEQISGADRDAIMAVIDTFRKDNRSFLVVSQDRTGGNDPVIDISHESLIRQWGQLRDWVDAESESRRRYRLIAEAAIREKNGQAGLWRDPELGLALKWQEEQRPTRAWGERYHPEYILAMDFLRRSKAANEARIAEEKKERQEKLERAEALARAEQERAAVERKRAEEQQAAAVSLRRQRRWLALLAVLAFITAVASLYLWQQATRATQQMKIAQEEAQRAYADQVKLNLALEDEKAKTDSLLTLTQLSNERLKVEQMETARLNSRLAREQERTLALYDSTREANALLAQEKARSDSLLDAALRARKATLSVALANRAQRQQRIGNADLGAMLAYLAYRYNKEIDGEFLDQVYDALRNTLNDPKYRSGGPVPLGSRHQDWVREVTFSPDNRLIVSASGDGTIRLWPAHDSSIPPRVLDRHERGVRALQFSPEGNRFVSADEGGRILLWDTTAARIDAPVEIVREGAPVWAMRFSPDGGRLITAGAGNAILAWDTVYRDSVDTVFAHSAPLRIRAMEMSRDGRFLITAGDDDTLRVIELTPDGGRPLLQRYASHDGVNALALHPNGSMLTSAGVDARIAIWDFDPDRRMLARVDSLVGHESPINALAFRPDGDVLASGSSDRSLRLWSFTDGRGNANSIFLQEHNSWVWSVAFSPDSKRVISGSADRSILEWVADPQILAERIETSVRRRLTDDEVRRYVGQDSLDIVIPAPPTDPRDGQIRSNRVDE